MVILGIDPGIAIVGYGAVEACGSKLRALDYGVIETKAGVPLPERLARVYDGMCQLITMYKPDTAAFEELFFYHNQTTAMIVSQARGVLLLAAQQAGIPSYEYTPLQIKQAVAGYGNAEKQQVQTMVKILLGLKAAPKPDDAADALAAAICQSNAIGPMLEQYRIK